MPRRDQILDAAGALFAERGPAAVSMDRVRRAAGASNGSLFHHFPRREDLLAALYLRTLGHYHAAIGRVLARAPAAGAEATVRSLVRAHLRWVERHRDQARLLHEMRWSEDIASARSDLAAMNRAMFARVRAWAGAEQGTLRPVSTDLLVAIVLGPAMEFTRAWLRDPRPARIRAAGPALADAAWHAIKRRNR